MLRPRVSVSRRPPASWQMFEGFRCLLFEMQRQKTHTQERVKEEQARKLRKYPADVTERHEVLDGERVGWLLPDVLVRLGHDVLGL